MLSCREVVPIMVAQGGGAIVNISSIGSLRYLNTPMAVYAAGKAALNGFTQNIALLYASKGVRANCVLMIARTPASLTRATSAFDRIAPATVSAGSAAGSTAFSA